MHGFARRRNVGSVRLVGRAGHSGGRPRSFAVLLCALVSFAVSSASASVTFAHRWHWFEGAAGHSVELMPDQGYLVSGETQLDSIHNGVVVFSADSLGDTTSVRQFPDYDPGSGLLCRLADSGYVVVGTRNNYQILVTKYTATGESLWAWLSPYAGLVSAVIPTFDRGCLVAGRIPDTDANFGMVKLTADGQQAWVRWYPDTRVYGSFARGVAQTRDSGFILCGDCFAYEGTYLRLVRTDASGDTLWTRLCTQVPGPNVPAVCITPDSGFLLAGSELDTIGTNVLLLLHINSAGDTVWSRNIARPGTQTSAAALALTRDGGSIVAGQIDWFDSARVWLVKLDSAGDTQWTSVLPGVSRENAASVRPTPDGGFVIVGASEADSQSLLLYKTDSLGRIASGIADERGSSHFAVRTPQLSVWPNPCSQSSLRSSHFAVSYSLPTAGRISLELFDISGKLVSTLVSGYHPAGSYAHRLSPIAYRLSPGVYLVELVAGSDRITRKLVLD